MNYIKVFRYVGIALVLFSLTIGFMLDCGFFSMVEIQTPVTTSFVCFLLGMTFLCYADEKLK
jgi:uncharacterized membrane protein